MYRPPSPLHTTGDTYSPDPVPPGYHTEFATGTSRIGEVTLARRFADGHIERESLHPFDAHLALVTDERHGLSVVGAWIEAGSEIDSGWTVSV